MEAFSRHVLLEQLVSDNWPPFTSTEFSEYCGLRGTEGLYLRRSVPTEMERQNALYRRLKNVLYKGLRKGKAEKVAICHLLFKYRVTSYVAAGRSSLKPPLMGRKIRPTLNIVTASVKMAPS